VPQAGGLVVLAAGVGVGYKGWGLRHQMLASWGSVCERLVKALIVMLQWYDCSGFVRALCVGYVEPRINAVQLREAYGTKRFQRWSGHR